MSATPAAFASKDNASSTLDSGISSSTLTIPLHAGDGALFPQPYHGTASSGGTSTTLNCTGISAAIGGSAALNKFILNKTDGSVAVITAVAADSLTTTALLGGTTNLWNNSDAWRIDEFVITLVKVSDSTTYEQVRVYGRSTDSLIVASTGERGYNGTVAQSFSAADYVYLFVTASIVERFKDVVAVLNIQLSTNTAAISTLSSDLASTSNGKGASMVGVEDAGGHYVGTTVESILAEVAVSLAATVQLTQIGFYGTGGTRDANVDVRASLDPTTAFNYTTATLPVSQTLTVSSVNTPLVIKASGNVTINGTIDLDGKGGAAGAAKTSAGVGNSGTPGNSLISGFTTGAGVGGAQGGSTAGAGGGSGASAFSAGSAGDNATDGGAAGGAAGAVLSASQLAFLASILRGVVCGAGGASGGKCTGGQDSGAGGAGGGAMVMFVGGNLTLGSSSTIRCRGAAGSNAVGGASGTGGGGGGGGGGGTIIIIVSGTITDGGVTLQSTGGAGGTKSGTSPNRGGNGATGPDGKIIIMSLTTQTVLVG